MQQLTRSLAKPIPLIGISGLILAGSIATYTRTLQHTNMSTSTPQSWPIKQYQPRHQTWPYKPSDFTRQDSTNDSNFYSQPRFVTHIDDAAIASLRAYYDQVLPRKGRILDFCSSYVSHFPAPIEKAAETGELEITGLGMNKAELDANPVLNAGRIVKDLNVDPEIATSFLQKEPGVVAPSSSSSASASASENSLLDASTNVVSTDYLTQPVAVLSNLLKVTKVGGTVHLTISNRCFPTKAISRWLRVDEEERLLMVGDFLHFAGWKKIEIVELSNGKVEEGAPQLEEGGGLKGIMAWMGMNQRDPLWVVRAVKE